MAWFKGGQPHISWENLWFPVKMFPSKTNPLTVFFCCSYPHGPDCFCQTQLRWKLNEQLQRQMELREKLPLGKDFFPARCNAWRDAKRWFLVAVSFWWLAPTVFDKLEVGSLLVPGRITSIEALGIIWNSAWETIKYWRFDDSRHVLIGILAESRCVFFKCFLVLALWFLLSQIDNLSWVVESLDFNSCGTWSSCFSIRPLSAIASQII